jgi:hypothetical protein
MAKTPKWHKITVSWCIGMQWRWARGDRSWGLKFRAWYPGEFAGMPRGLRFPGDRYLPLWPADPDYEMIATRHGWERGGDCGGFIYHRPTWGSWKAAASWSGDPEQEPSGPHDRPATYDTWEACCLSEDLR